MNLARSYRINIETVLKLIILLGFALFFYITIQSGKALLYIHPRLIPYMKFGIVAMVLVALFIARDLFKPKRNANLAPYLFFVIPLFMAFAIPAKSMDSTSMSFSKIKIAGQTGNTVQNNVSSKNIEDYSSATNDNLTGNDFTTNTATSNDTASNKLTGNNTANNNAVPAVDNNPSSDPLSSAQANSDQMRKPLEMQNNTIIMDDDNFTQWMDELYLNMEKYEGKKIQLVGLVFKNGEFKKNEFVPARLMMTCCSADLQPIGFLCRYDKASELNKDTWVKVTGTIKNADYKGYKMPIIVAEKVEKAEKPKSEYVYPNY